jgi:hypothetical protein
MTELSLDNLSIFFFALRTLKAVYVSLVQNISYCKEPQRAVEWMLISYGLSRKIIKEVISCQKFSYP